MNLSPDGETVALIHRNGALDVVQHGITRTYTRGPTRCAAFSHDGARLAVAYDTCIVVVDLPSFKQGTTFELEAGEVVVAMAFSRDGRVLAAGMCDDRVLLHEQHRVKKRVTLVPPKHTHLYGFTRNSTLAFSADGALLVFIGLRSTFVFSEKGLKHEVVYLPIFPLESCTAFTFTVGDAIVCADFTYPDGTLTVTHVPTPARSDHKTITKNNILMQVPLNDVEPDFIGSCKTTRMRLSPNAAFLAIAYELVIEARHRVCIIHVASAKIVARVDAAAADGAIEDIEFPSRGISSSKSKSKSHASACAGWLSWLPCAGGGQSKSRTRWAIGGLTREVVVAVRYADDRVRVIDVNQVARTGARLARVRDELMAAAWAPRRFLDWCVDVEEQSFIRAQAFFLR